MTTAEYDTGLEATLRRVANEQSNQADIERLRRWIYPDQQARIIHAYLTLSCEMGAARQYIAQDLRAGLAQRLAKDSDD